MYICYNDGYCICYNDGYCICYNDGYRICYNDGYCFCYNDGYCICYNDGYCICYNDGELYSEIHFDSKWCVLLGIFPKFLLQLERKEHLLKNCNDVHLYNFKCLWWNVTCLMNERLFFEVDLTILKPFCLFLLWNPQSDCLSFICILHSSKFSLSTFHTICHYGCNTMKYITTIWQLLSLWHHCILCTYKCVNLSTNVTGPTNINYVSTNYATL